MISQGASPVAERGSVFRMGNQRGSFIGIQDLPKFVQTVLIGVKPTHLQRRCSAVDDDSASSHIISAGEIAPKTATEARADLRSMRPAVRRESRTRCDMLGQVQESQVAPLMSQGGLLSPLNCVLEVRT